MKKTIKFLLALHFIYYATNIQGQANQFSPNQYLVQVSPSALSNPELVEGILDEHNAIQVWADSETRIQLWEVISFPYTTQDGIEITNINESTSHTRDKTEIDGADLNYIGETPDFGTVSYACTQLNFPILLPEGDHNVKISILDTGISEITDNSNNEYDFSLEDYTGYDYVNYDPIPEDEHGHGSHLAGVIAAIVNHDGNHHVQFDIRKTHDASGSGYLSATIRAIKDAVEAGSNIINMSFSHTASGPNEGSILQRAIEYAEQNNVLVIASAGNNSINNDHYQNASYPATFPNANIVSVGGVDCYNEMAPFSNYGVNSVDVAILGVGVLGPDLEQGIVPRTGTSQAAAITSGLSAVLATHLYQFSPELIKCALIYGSRPAVGLEGLILSGGTIDGNLALDRLLSGTCNFIGQTEKSLGKNLSTRKEIQLYPNPAYDFLTLNTAFANEDEVQVRIIDMTGKIHLNQVKSSGTIQLDISTIEPGFYQIAIFDGIKHTTKSFVKL